MNTWRNIPGKVWIALLSLDPFLKGRALKAASLLPDGESQLFLSMSRYDLAHAMTVAKRLRDDPLLVRAALLHDSGKLRSELGLFMRQVLTALEVLAPRELDRMTREVEAKARGERPVEKTQSLQGTWKKGLYTQAHHGEIAAELLRGLGSEDELVRLVAGHQKEPFDERSRRLREVDDRF
jgi:hypothetical protein